jgi:cell wall-associated NlpC family hydrolase
MAAMAPEVTAASHAHGRGGAGKGRFHGGGGGGHRTRTALGAVLALLALPVLGMLGVLVLVVVGGGAAADPSTGCGGATVGTVALDGEQMVNATTIIATTAGRGLPVFAGVVAITTAYTESTLHNSSTETDHDSEGLFQQRISIYTKPVADDPVKATNAFLDRLVGIPDWQTGDPGLDAQTVQASQYPDRYDTHAAFATQLVGQLWPAAAAAARTGAATPATSDLAVDAALRVAAPAPRPSSNRATSASTTSGSTTSGSATSPRPASTAGPAPTVILPCTGGGSPGPVGRTGNNVAGRTTVPAGFVVTGSAHGKAAVTFALAQLGKPYVYGAAGPNSWDCSGLTMAAWATQGVALAHFTGTQARQGTPEPVDLSAAAAGDLVLIPGADGTAAAPGHVGMIAGTSPGPNGRTRSWIVQAPMTGIPVELTDTTAWAGQVVDVRHLA